MSKKYHVTTEQAEPRFFPVPRYSAIESEGCLGCLECVKQQSCIYDVYKKRKFDSTQVVDTTDVLCISCMRCVQECKKNILFRTTNPQYDAMGDEYWRPDIITSIWDQSTSGSIPVSGAGYRGPFAGPGFDAMWTDMSEIVRPTRDGIHGREYISTVIELGRRPEILEFDDEQKVITEMPNFEEIPIPMILDSTKCNFVKDSTKRASANAAKQLKTFAVASLEDVNGALADYRSNLIVQVNAATDDISKLEGIKIVELRYSEDTKKNIISLFWRK